MKRCNRFLYAEQGGDCGQSNSKKIQPLRVILRAMMFAAVSLDNISSSLAIAGEVDFEYDQLMTINESG